MVHYNPLCVVAYRLVRTRAGNAAVPPIFHVSRVVTVFGVLVHWRVTVQLHTFFQDNTILNEHEEIGTRRYSRKGIYFTLFSF